MKLSAMMDGLFGPPFGTPASASSGKGERLQDGFVSEYVLFQKCAWGIFLELLMQAR